MTKRSLGTRAVIRAVEPGNEATCVSCGKAVKFQAHVHHRKRRQVIANIYVAETDSRPSGERRALRPGRGGVWDRVEHFHLECYELAGQPYGDAGKFVTPGAVRRNLDEDDQED